jgi:HEAT repeat protein
MMKHVARRAAIGAGVWFALACALVAQSDPEKDIKSKDAEQRVAAVAALKGLGVERAEKPLIAALGDKDWEVVESAATALGELRAKGASAALVKTALEAPAARVRRAAAQALTQLDPLKAAGELGKQTAGKNALHAWEALAYVAASPEVGGDEALTKNLRKSQKAKEDAERVAAAAGINALAASERIAALDEYIAGGDVRLASAALAAIGRRATADAVPVLQKALEKSKVDDVLERRLIAATTAVAATVGAEAVQPLLDALTANSDAAVAARAMRLAHSLAPTPAREIATAALTRGGEHANADVRAAALHAGCALKIEALQKRARTLAAQDKDDRVRLVALRSTVSSSGVGDAEVLALALAKLKEDPSALVREEAAVALARATSAETIAALDAATADRDWAVAACSAVSLGKTLQEQAVAPLLRLSKSEDWRLRGAAIVGLCHVTKKEAIPAIIAALGDAEPAIARSAWNYLRALSRQDLPLAAEPWQGWWRDNEARIRMWTPQEAKERREKYGYSQSIVEVFRDLDVVVLDSRGDHIQKVLDMVRATERNEPKAAGASRDDANDKAIAYRLTAAARHREDGLHPHAVYVSNCTGEVEPEDLERIAWFVRTGGYLFGSCWSLHETIEKVYPGVVRKFPTSSEVLDTVEAEPCAAGSAYLEGVFEGGVQPQYNLEGAHLIEVLDRERCEVLVDSPQCATRWGIGNLAVWFRAGHGLILDSVNHFDNQGLTNANWIKEVEERQAYAVDHMGLSYAELRASLGEKWWGGNTKAAERIYDRTALKLVTNIVRSKRLEEP